tara:strand:- start:3728 stop:3874 length:147 start_codon:yes stop_codon:yes gene_type:complete
MLSKGIASTIGILVSVVMLGILGLGRFLNFTVGVRNKNVDSKKESGRG